MAEAAVAKSMLKSTVALHRRPLQLQQLRSQPQPQQHQRDVCCGKCERCKGQTCVSDDDAVVCASCHALFCKHCIDCVCPQCACCSLCEEGKARIYRSICKSCSLESKE